MSAAIIDVAIIGAGPYGLSIAAQLPADKVSFRVFGTPMSSWRYHMPGGTFLKSDGFASTLYAPNQKFTLADYCAEQVIPYDAVGLPVSIETFVAYGLAFQARFVPQLEQTDIVSVTRAVYGFDLVTATGETVRAKRVVVAAGITHFGYVPPLLENLPGDRVTHSSQHQDLTPFRDRKVAVLGAGASAIDLAGLLHEVGAEVSLVARRSAIAFHNRTLEPRPLRQRLLMPRSGLGLGWRSRLCSDLPLVFHAMPSKLRIRAVQRHLGPAPGWFAKEKVAGKVTMHLGTRLQAAKTDDRGISLTVAGQDGSQKELAVDHVIAATGYKPKLGRLGFLDQSLRTAMKCIEDTPILDQNFESSVPGLYLVGLASSYSFGPLTRFAFGAGFTSQRLSRKLT